MLTVHKIEVWTSDPFEEIAHKISTETDAVKFGFLDVHKTNYRNLHSVWIGEVDHEKRTFKLYRRTGDSSTSDFAVVGNYVERSGKPVIAIRFKLIWSGLIGLAGLMVCVYALWFLFQKKNVMVGPAWLAFWLISVATGFSFFMLRDLNKTTEEIKRTISKEIVPLSVLRMQELGEEDDERDEDDD
jgi:hypothetical protein